MSTNRLRIVATIAAPGGAVGSVALVLFMGRHNKSYLLLALFVVWVSSPFMSLVFTNLVARRWPVFSQTALYYLMPVFAVGSLAIYGYVTFGPPRPKPAFYFLVVPLVSWLLIAGTLAIAAKTSGGSADARR